MGEEKDPGTCLASYTYGMMTLYTGEEAKGDSFWFEAHVTDVNAFTRREGFKSLDEATEKGKEYVEKAHGHR